MLPLLLSLCLCPSLQPAEAEAERVHAHFVQVVAELSAAPVDHLDAHQRRRRAARLADVAAYGEARLFPDNPEPASERQPHFIDARGTRCAVGYLLELTGEGELAHRIAALTPHVRVTGLAAEPTFGRWLDEQGLTLAEVARIQPEYEHLASDCVCGEWWEDEGTPRPYPTEDCPHIYPVAGPPGLTRKLFEDALSSADCRATLVADDPRWAYRVEEGYGPDCAAMPGGHTPRGWVLVAPLLLLALGARRGRSR